MEAGTEIDTLVDLYLAGHRDFGFPPSGDRHPSVLAMTTQMAPWLTERLGGPIAYWEAMLRAAQAWFPPGTDSRELNLFRARFEAAMNVCDGHPEVEHLNRQYAAWRAWRKAAAP